MSEELLTPEASKLEELREKVAQLVRDTGYFTDTQVLTHQTGNLVQAFNIALGEAELCAVVQLRSATESRTQTDRVEWNPALVDVFVFENYEMHQGAEGGKPGAWAYAEALVAAMKNQKLDGDSGPLLEVAKEDLREAPVEGRKDLLCVTFCVSTRLAGNNRSST
jgi:hypothetical protein